MTSIERTYFPSGRIELEYETLDGVKHGFFRRYHENGVIACESHFIQGSRSGDFKFWYANGQIEDEGWVEDGKEFSRNCWLEDGTQTMKDGTGYWLRRWPPIPGTEITEQYFEHYVRVGHKVIGRHP
jgi:hypothetical protein